MPTPLSPFIPWLKPRGFLARFGNKNVPAVQDARRRILEAAIVELEQLHGLRHRHCRDEGPDTCPTWGAIHGLRSLLPPA